MQVIPDIMSFTCCHHSLEFDNKNQYNGNTRKCAKTMMFDTYNGQTITLTHTENKKFMCYCSNKECPRAKGFSTMNALQKHMKGLQSTWLGPEKKVIVLFHTLVKDAAHAWVLPTESTCSTSFAKSQDWYRHGKHAHFVDSLCSRLWIRTWSLHHQQRMKMSICTCHNHKKYYIPLIYHQWNWSIAITGHHQS